MFFRPDRSSAPRVVAQERTDTHAARLRAHGQQPLLREDRVRGQRLAGLRPDRVALHERQRPVGVRVLERVFGEDEQRGAAGGDRPVQPAPVEAGWWGEAALTDVGGEAERLLVQAHHFRGDELPDAAPDDEVDVHDTARRRLLPKGHDLSEGPEDAAVDRPGRRFQKPGVDSAVPQVKEPQPVVELPSPGVRVEPDHPVVPAPLKSRQDCREDLEVLLPVRGSLGPRDVEVHGRPGGNDVDRLHRSSFPGGRSLTTGAAVPSQQVPPDAGHVPQHSHELGIVGADPGHAPPAEGLPEVLVAGGPRLPAGSGCPR